MSRFILTVLLVVVALECAAQRSAIVNVTVVNVAGPKELSTGQTVIISGNKIVRIGPWNEIKVPPGTTIIDGKDKFLIPGLWDMHVHLSYYGDEALQMLITNGVTSVRDMGGDLKQIDQWRKDIKEGKINGPMIFRAGPFVDGPKNMDAQRQSFTKLIQTEQEGRAVVDELKKLGVDFIKIHSRVPKDAFFGVADEAKKQGLPLMVHAPREVSVTEISNAGARTIEHTESLLGAAIYEKDPAVRDRMTDEAFRKLETDSVFSIIKKNGNFYNPTVVSLYLLKGTDYEKKLGPRLLPLVTKLHAAGVPLLTGSDFATKDAGIVPGKDLHGELELFVEAGLTPIEALRAGTINAAACMHVGKDVGSISQGKLANMVLLDANPLTDIRNTRKISRVFVNGKPVEK